MTEEEKRQQANNQDRTASPISRRSLLEGTGVAAAALGSAAILYRTGSVSRFAKSLDKGYRFAKNTGKTFGKLLGTESMTIDDVRLAAHKIKKDWRTLSKVSSKTPVSLRADNPNTMFALMHSLENAKTNSGHIAGKLFEANMLVTPAKDMYFRNYHDGNLNTERRFMKFIREVSQSVHDEETVQTAYKRAGFDEKQRQNAGKLVDLMRANDNQAARQNFNKSVREAANSAYEKLHDINYLEKKWGNQSLLGKGVDAITGDHGATVRDILANRAKIRKSSASLRKDKNGSYKQNETLDLLEELRQHYAKQGKEFEERFMNLRPDSGALRMSPQGELYSFNAPSEIMQDALSVGALTIPGKILKLRDLEQEKKAPIMSFIGSGTKDPSLAAIVNPVHKDGSKNKTVEGNYVRILDEVYRIGDNGLEDNPVATGIRAMSSRFGWAQRMQHQLAGDTGFEESSHLAFRLLDIGQDRDHFSGSPLSGITGVVKKFADKDWRQNVFERLLNPNEDELKAFKEAIADPQANLGYAVSYLDNAKRAQKFLKENTYSLTEDSLVQLEKNADGRAKGLFNSLRRKDDQELLNEILQMDPEEFQNQDLKHLMSRYIHDPIGTQNNMMYLRTDRTRLSTGGGSVSDLVTQDYGTESADFWELLRTEVGKEAFLQHAADNGDKEVLSLVESASSILPSKEATETKRLAQLALFQKRTGLNDEMHVAARSTNEIWDEVRRIEGVMNTNTDAVDQEFRKEFHNMMNENISVTEAREVDKDIFAPEAYNTVIHTKAAVSPFDVIRSLNESIKNGSTQPIKDTGSLFFKQFVAGRDDMENVTSATYMPYFLLSRLSDDMNTFGLGFSRESMGSVGQLATSIFTKRILPVAIGATYLEWADDTSQEITGTSISGAFANGLANVDLAARKALDSFGITPWLNELKSVNPIMQYWGDKTNFMGYDERKKYYESGYDPQRKAPWWTFGGVQEARGGEIEYWAPSFARRINSDYKDKALYDGYFDKWSHSWLPTPSNPFSPVKALLDPYWLEEKHADDRPYVLSAPMFAEGTPWGAVLNPTVGAILKPQKELHPDRLRNGVDIKSALHALNENIKAKARDLSETNMIAVKGDTATPVRFTAFDAPTEDTKAMSVQYSPAAGGLYTSSDSYGVYSPQEDISAGFTKFYSGGGGSGAGGGGGSVAKTLLDDYGPISLTALAKNALFSDEKFHRDGEIMQTPDGQLGVYHTPTNKAKTTRELKKASDLSLEESLKLDAYVNGDDGSKLELAKLVHDFNPKNLLRQQNEAIKGKAQNSDSFDESEGIITPEKLSHFRPSQGMELLSDPDMIQELIHTGKGSDFVKEATTSARLITGIYGYMGSEAFDFGNYNEKFLANASDMTSLSRAFWDSSIGGAGGETADIIRRFIPDYKRGNRLNPLMNNMPDWLPDRFRYGDPFTIVKNGEMRLPGKGWESLNQLHPDQYGDYGAFDRFKILADIAPFSPEYKMWREIAKKTVTDPALKEEMAEIRSRVSQQGRKHDFYNYNVVGKSLDYENVTVSEVLGYGKFRSGSTIYKIAGARVLSNENQSMSDVLGKYLHEGMTVTIAKDSDEAYQTNNDADHTTNVAVYIDGNNLAEEMIQNGDAARKKGDTSAPAVLGRLSTTQRTIGYISELVAHADLPWISDQWLRVRTPLESYKAEQVYGTPYQSWDHPIDSFLLPAWERAIHQTGYVKTAMRMLFENVKDMDGISKTKKHMAMMGYVFTDRGAFIGGAVANLIAPGKAKLAYPAMRITSQLATMAHFMTGGNSMFDEITSGASIGMDVAHFFKKERGIGVAVGAAVGAAYRMLFGEKGDWIPERTKKKWEMEDYFDRLTYLKYMGLYHEAARRAKDEEGVDVEDLSDRLEEKESKIQQAVKRLKKLKDALRSSNDHVMNDDKKDLMKALNKKINALGDDTTIIEGGKWTHTALIYKQAAESTMYGIGQNSSWAQIITALPTSDKEYFMEFVKERDPDKRQEILRFASPALQKALSLAWGTDAPKTESNQEYFKKHKLPTSKWKGWTPDVDLKDVEIKTIENEGMLLSDFGFYESQLRDPEVANAPAIDYHSRDNASSVKSNIKKILSGRGLKDIDINVTSNTDIDTHRIISDIAVYTGSSKLQKMVDNSIDQQTS